MSRIVIFIVIYQRHKPMDLGKLICKYELYATSHIQCEYCKGFRRP
jgi:hypothetical protein